MYKIKVIQSIKVLHVLLLLRTPVVCHWQSLEAWSYIEMFLYFKQTDDTQLLNKYTQLYSHTAEYWGAPTWAPHRLYIYGVFFNEIMIQITSKVLLVTFFHTSTPNFWALNPKLVIEGNQNSLLYFLPFSIIFKQLRGSKLRKTVVFHFFSFGISNLPWKNYQNCTKN